MHLKRNLSGLILTTMAALTLGSCNVQRDYSTMIRQGQFKRATRAIRFELFCLPTLDAARREELNYELLRIDRIRKDFTKTEKDVLEYIRKYIPTASFSDLRRWERAKALEFMRIDGKKWYFNNAAQNLFRLDPLAKKIKQTADSLRLAQHPEYNVEEFPLAEHAARIIKTTLASGAPAVHPVTLKIRQSIAVQANAVPAGAMLRAWIPFPRVIPQRQGDIKIMGSQPERYVLADNDYSTQRTIYFEQPAVVDSVTRFSVEYVYTVRGRYVPIDPDKVQITADRSDLQPYLREEAPHILFTDEIRRISAAIVGQEKNPYRIAQKLFEWVDVNIPWASAREYSTFYNIPDYVLANRHGDCGMQTLTFITLCRLNGIPARWQSGWEFQPPDDSMHDWGEIYFEPYGWVPMDVTYGLFDSADERLKWFYLSGMDSYRLIFNDGISDRFYPAKVYPRSETVDSQRGEVEWSGGNLYYDQWDWDFEWKVIAAQ